jgi:hypothetical protein
MKLATCTSRSAAAALAAVSVDESAAVARVNGEEWSRGGSASMHHRYIGTLRNPFVQ